MPKTPRSYDDLVSPPRHPVSALFHENTKLGERSVAAFLERVARELPPPVAKTYPTREKIALPEPRRGFFTARPRLDEVLARRRSPRGQFGRDAVDRDALAGVLATALGPTDEGRRAWPSAGGLYPLEAYVIATNDVAVPRGVYHYDPFAHALARIGACPSREALAKTILAEAPPESESDGDRPANRWDTAAFALVFTAVFERTQSKYGERGYRFVLLDAGHAGQNVLLAAEAYDCAALPLGGFCEDALGDLLELDRDVESPIHVVLLGSRPK